MIVATATLCLALNVYHEARGDSLPGQMAVALVTLNRAREPEQVCHTVFAPHQFSWTSTARRVGRGWELPARLEPREQRAWDTAKTTARLALSGRQWDFTRGADHYHAPQVHPVWATKLGPAHRIGLHVFYRSGRQSALTVTYNERGTTRFVLREVPCHDPMVSPQTFICTTGPRSPRRPKLAKTAVFAVF